MVVETKYISLRMSYILGVVCRRSDYRAKFEGIVV